MPVINLVEKGIAGIIVGCPGSGRSAFIRFLLSHKWENNANKKIFLYCHLKELNIETPEEFAYSILNQLSKRKGREEFSFLNENLFLGIVELRREIKRFIDSGFKIIIIVDGLDSKKKSLLLPVQQICYSLWQTERVQPLSKVSVIFIVSPNLLGEEFLTEEGKKMFSNNLIFLPLLNKEEFFWLVEREAYFYGLKFNKKHLEKIWEVCGPIGNRIRDIIFFLARHKDKASSEIENLLFAEHDFNSGVVDILESLGPTLKQKLKKAMNENIILSPNDTLILLGLIHHEGNRYKLFSKLATFYFSSSKNGKDKRFRIVSKLTERERRFLGLFLKSNGKLITKERIAKIIWGSNFEEHYSEWAITKAINRFKKKILTQDGEPAILTVRNNGYRLRI